MAIILTESQVTSLLDMPMAMTAVEDVLRNQAEGYATNRPRQRVFGNAALLHVMAGGDRRLGVYGLKTYSVSKNGARFLVLLFDSTSGDLLAMIEADRLGEMRTGAASGVATKYMARLDADTVGIIGTGWQAESQLMAVCAARQIRHVKAYSRSAEKRNAFAKRMSSIVGVEVEPVSTAEEAVRGRSIVITATTSREPVLQGAWIEPGTHLNIAGSNSLAKAEVDIDAIKRAAIIAVDSIEQSKMEAGDLLPALERGLISWESVSELG
ncbi:MAG TPA: ornithine cyclodeaminase family protein, partial [Blastocatellia bacterium]|nr:ornithine cyclodeaminase family protein [Blastocatellia bacterium]